MPGQDEATASRTALRICPLCEATCGLTLTIEGTTVTAARGDRDDVFSHGFVCPKGAAFADLDADPDRLTGPLVREDGVLREATWGEAFDLVAARLRPLIEEYGPDSVGVVLGNPNVHTMAGALYPPLLLSLLRTRSLFTASTVDQMPKHVSSGLLFGDPLAIPVPDLDRTGHLLLLGANPLDSNGSLCTAPDFPGRLKALRRRCGTLVVVDPRRTRTARLADRHVPIRPGTDALLLAALAQVLFEEKLTAPGVLEEWTEGFAEVREAVRDFTPEAVSAACDVPADEIRLLARGLAAAPTAAVYGRVGSSTVEFGTLANWLVDVLNILTGNLDRPGGALFPLSATAPPPPPPPDPAGGFGARPLEEQGERSPRDQGRTAAGGARRGDRHAGGGAGARVDHHCRQPRALRARRPPPRPRPERAPRLHGQRRSVPQRDLAPRRCRPAPAAPVAERALRLHLQHLRRAQPGALHPGRRPPGGRADGRERDPRPADPRGRRHARRRPLAPSTTSPSSAPSPRPSPHPTRPSTGATPGSSPPHSPGAADPSGAST